MSTTTTNGSARSRDERLVANYLASRLEFFRRAGMVLDERRNYTRDCHYPTHPVLPEFYQTLYQSDPLANRVVVVRPQASWQAKLCVYEDEDESTETDFEAALKEAGKGSGGEPSYLDDDGLSWLREALRQADELSGIGQYAALLVGTDDGLPLDQPARGFEESNSAPAGRDASGQPYSANATGPYRLTVNAKAAKGTKLTYLRVFPEYLAPVSAFENNPTSPRYCRPTSYLVTFNDPSAGTQAQATSGAGTATRAVHWSRVVHVALGRRSSPVFAPPRMEHVLYPLLDARKVRGASAEGFWQQAFALLFLLTQPGAAGGIGGGDVDYNADSLKDMLENIRNGLQRDGVLSGFEPRSVAPMLADPSPHLDAAVRAISIGIDCPKRVFEGSEVGVLASDQDTRDWLASIRLRNHGELTPGLVGPAVSRLVSLGVLPKPAKGFRADWDDVSTQTDQEKATVFLTRVQAYAAYVAGNVEALFPPLDAMTRLDGMTHEEARTVLDAAQSAADDTLTVPPAANVFCPTGEGGGVDPSCSPGGAAGTTPGTATGTASGPRATGSSRAAYHGPEAPAAGWTRAGTDAHGNGVWAPPAAKQGLLGKLFGGGKAADAGPAGHTTAETLKERALASKEYQAQAARVAAKNDPVYSQLAAGKGMTPEAYKAEVAGKLQKLADDQHVYVRTRPETLEKILAGGRVLTQHETGKSGGGVTAQQMRRDVEANGMGVPKDAPAQVRPVSAYLGRKDFATTQDDDRTVTGYGSVVVRLKDSVRDRSTVTAGDSLSEISQGNAVATPLRAVGHESLSPHELAFHGEKMLDSPQAYRAAKPFAEVQVHDGLNVSDVHEIGFHAAPAQHVQDALSAKGIPWRVYKGPAGNARPARNRGVPTVNVNATGPIFKGDGEFFIVTTGHKGGLDYGVLADVGTGEVFPEQPVLTYMRMSGGSGWEEYAGDPAPVLALLKGANP